MRESDPANGGEQIGTENELTTEKKLILWLFDSMQSHAKAGINYK